MHIKEVVGGVGEDVHIHVSIQQPFSLSFPFCKVLILKGVCYIMSGLLIPLVFCIGRQKFSFFEFVAFVFASGRGR